MSEEVDVHIGTLSKAMGAHGGFVACQADIRTFLLNKGRPYIFSTAAAAPVLAAAMAALKINDEVMNLPAIRFTAVGKAHSRSQ